jgi:osmotically-inducible protein OsmY
MMVDQADVLERAGFAISQNPHLAQKNVQLRVDGDCVKLSGNVATFFQKQMAQETLRSIVTPLRIENELIVD